MAKLIFCIFLSVALFSCKVEDGERHSNAVKDTGALVSHEENRVAPMQDGCPTGFISIEKSEGMAGSASCIEKNNSGPTSFDRATADCASKNATMCSGADFYVACSQGILDGPGRANAEFSLGGEIVSETNSKIMDWKAAHHGWKKKEDINYTYKLYLVDCKGLQHVQDSENYQYFRCCTN